MVLYVDDRGLLFFPDLPLLFRSSTKRKLVTNFDCLPSLFQRREDFFSWAQTKSARSEPSKTNSIVQGLWALRNKLNYLSSIRFLLFCFNNLKLPVKLTCLEMCFTANLSCWEARSRSREGCSRRRSESPEADRKKWPNIKALCWLWSGQNVRSKFDSLAA